ncbi:OVARIAN TUMOR DOMAIN-containing deubiquitinating enzyme 7-like isoform X3 [Zingiber officinale]|nr:OVARIAN TUMOR DOMAIN-containing deubiquitinating enzyme 7-like isoform X3 [Zingiber officinale]
MVVKYIMNHREDFEPFIEDEVPFDEYCRTMEKDGTWAGNMELQAASLVTRRNICIHRFSSPRWYISNFSGHQDDMIHLCYHDGEHYNSVRLKEDSCEGPARPIIIKVDAHISRKDHDDKATTNKSSKGSSCRSFNRESVKLVMMGTGCKDVDKVEQVLQEVDGDVDAAIEFLIAEQDMDLHENAQSSNDRSMENDLVQDFSGEGQSQEPGLPEVASEDLRLDQNEKQGKKDCSRKSKMKCQACFSSTGKTSPSVRLTKEVDTSGVIITKGGDVVFYMSYINTQATNSYKDAVRATEGIEAPALGFCRPAEYKGATSSSTAIIKQANTQIQLLVSILEKLESLEERIKKIEGKIAVSSNLQQETALPDNLIQSLTDRIKTLSIQEKPKESKGKLRVFTDPFTILEEEQAKVRKQ